MDPMTVSSGLCLLGWVFKLGRWVKNKVKCPSVFCVIVPAKAGKSSLIQSVETDDFYLCDVEQKIRAVLDEKDLAKLDKMKQHLSEKESNEYFNDLVKEHLKEYRKKHPKAKIIVFTSDPRLPKYLGISEVLYFAPSNKLFTWINNQHPDEGAKKLINFSRDMVLKHASSKLQIYNSFEQLTNILCARFKLKMKL